MTHANTRSWSQARADLHLESALQTEIARLNANLSVARWTPPKLPYSVMACIWTYRLVGVTQPLYDPRRDYLWSLRNFNWGYRREAPYIVAAALLNLRDAGLIAMSVGTHSGPIDTLSSVRIERAGVAVTLGELPLVEGGLLTACDDIAHRRFFRTTTPSVGALVKEFIQVGGADPFKWVISLAVAQGRQLGLYLPAVKKRGKAVYVLEHLAACEDQVVAFTARWQEFGTTEPELQQRLLTEAAFGILGRQTSG